MTIVTSPSEDKNWRARPAKADKDSSRSPDVWASFNHCSKKGDKQEKKVKNKPRRSVSDPGAPPPKGKGWRGPSSSPNLAPSNAVTWSLIPGQQRHQTPPQKVRCWAMPRKGQKHVAPVDAAALVSDADKALSAKAPAFSPFKSQLVCRNPLGGKLTHFAAQFFSQAYGLDGTPRRDHGSVVLDAITLTGCSPRAIKELLYGHSYGEQLQALRAKVVGYPPKIKCKAERIPVMTKIMDNLESQSFYYFDGNKAEAAPTSASPASAVQA